MSLFRTLALAGLLALGATSASAHIVLQETQAAAGAYYVAAFRVGHGCGDGQSTTALAVQLPEGVADAKVQPKPGWTVSRAGNTVTWTGRLDDDAFDLFTLLVKLPARPGSLYFPTMQSCGATMVHWMDIPEPGQPWTSKPRPAPVVNLTGGTAAAPAAGSGDAHAGH